MVSKILIVKNIEREGPGKIVNWLDAKGIQYDVVEAHDELLFADFHHLYSGLIVLGGPASANDRTFLIQRQTEFIQKWLGSGKPYLGVCLGLQLMIKALGGEVFQNTCREIGFYHLDDEKNPYLVELQEIKKNELTPILPAKFQVFQLHGETVSHSVIPSLAKTKFCNYQICSPASKQIGVQFHLELTKESLKKWLSQDDFLIDVDRQAYFKWFELHEVELEKNCFALLDYIFA